MESIGPTGFDLWLASFAKADPIQPLEDLPPTSGELEVEEYPVQSSDARPPVALARQDSTLELRPKEALPMVTVATQTPDMLPGDISALIELEGMHGMVEGGDDGARRKHSSSDADLISPLLNDDLWQTRLHPPEAAAVVPAAHRRSVLSCPTSPIFRRSLSTSALPEPDAMDAVRGRGIGPFHPRPSLRLAHRRRVELPNLSTLEPPLSPSRRSSRGLGRPQTAVGAGSDPVHEHALDPQPLDYTPLDLHDAASLASRFESNTASPAHDNVEYDCKRLSSPLGRLTPSFQPARVQCHPRCRRGRSGSWT